MIVEQIYTGCLAQGAYYIQSENEAAIIDPLREVKPYIEKAAAAGAQIKYVFETHFHADFVSGHVELLKKTGAKIVYGPGANPTYDILSTTDGQELLLGKSIIKVIHTPGHTLESACYLAVDESSKPVAVFTGDTLFVGDVGRVDLAAKSNFSSEQMAAMLYESLEKLKKLSNDVILYPGHGAGSACGKNISKETTSTIGQQKLNNYAMQPMSKEAFVKIVSEGISAPPKYFFTDVMLNHTGYQDETKVGENSKPVSIDMLKKEMQAGTILLDTRNPEDFATGHIPGAVNIGLDGQYAIWTGNLFDNVPFLIVSDEGKEKESVVRLARIGYDKIKGYLHGGIKAWKDAGLALQTVDSIDATDFVNKVGKEGKTLDVRNEDELAKGVVKDAITIPLARLENELSLLDKNTTYYVHCQGGYRSMIAISLLQKNGFTKLINVSGGINAITKTGIKLEVPEMA